MAYNEGNPLDHPEVRLASTRSYLVGFLASLGLMAWSLGLVVRHPLSLFGSEVAISIIAVVAVLTLGRFLFHLDWSETQRWHTLAFWLTVPLFVLLVGLSMWMFHSLDVHTVVAGLG